MKIDINTNQYNERLYHETMEEILLLPGIKEEGDKTDYELITLRANGRICIKAIEIALRKGIAD